MYSWGYAIRYNIYIEYRIQNIHRTCRIFIEKGYKKYIEYKIEYRESLHHAAKDHTDRLLQSANNDEVEQHQVSESLYVKSLVNKGVIDQE